MCVPVIISNAKMNIFWHFFFPLKAPYPPSDLLLSKKFQRILIFLNLWEKYFGFPKLHCFSDFSTLLLKCFIVYFYLPSQTFQFSYQHLNACFTGHYILNDFFSSKWLHNDIVPTRLINYVHLCNGHVKFT